MRFGRPNDNATHKAYLTKQYSKGIPDLIFLESESLKKSDNKILTYIDSYSHKRIYSELEYKTPAGMLHGVVTAICNDQDNVNYLVHLNCLFLYFLILFFL